MQLPTPLVPPAFLILTALVLLAVSSPASTAGPATTATATATATTAPAPAPAPAELRVMSFNIRYPAPSDVPAGNGWPARKEMVFNTIEAFDPDLIGLQEVVPTQGEELKARFAKTHDFIGVPRNDGKSAGEMVPILFRRDRFKKMRDGTFWLSETPDAVGSRGWDANLPRIVTWVELRDRKHDDRRLVFFNTHFDHIGQQARLESAKLLRKRMLEIAGADAAVIVTGDFNAPQDSPPYEELLGDAAEPLPLVDTFKEATPRPTAPEYTFHGFTGKNPRGDRIDWVLRSKEFKTSSAAIDRTNEGGRYPSDHYPVTAVLEWR